MLFVENEFPVKLCWHRKFSAMTKPQKSRTIFSSVGKVIMKWNFHSAILFYSAWMHWMFKMLNQIVDTIYKAFKWLWKFFKYKICWNIIFKLQWWKFSLKYKNGNIFIVFIYIAHSLYKIYFMLNVPTFCKWIFLKVHTFCEREIWEKKKHKKGKITETAMKQRSQIVVHKNCLCDTHDSIFSGISYKKNDWSEAVMNFV